MAFPLISSLGEIKITIKKGELIIPCMSPSNSPILPINNQVEKHGDLHKISELNMGVIPRHPAVPHPYAISAIPVTANIVQ